MYSFLAQQQRSSRTCTCWFMSFAVHRGLLLLLLLLLSIHYYRRLYSMSSCQQYHRRLSPFTASQVLKEMQLLILYNSNSNVILAVSIDDGDELI